MAKRLIDTSFLQSAALLELDNETRLFYLYMICQADDLGFVDTIAQIGKLLGLNEEESYKKVECLVEKGYAIEFQRTRDKIYLIKHWFIHNKYRGGLWTRFEKQRGKVKLVYNVYEFKEETLKESNINQNKVNQININNDEPTQEEWNGLIKELTEDSEND